MLTLSGGRWEKNRMRAGGEDGRIYLFFSWDETTFGFWGFVGIPLSPQGNGETHLQQEHERLAFSNSGEKLLKRSSKKRKI